MGTFVVVTPMEIFHIPFFSILEYSDPDGEGDAGDVKDGCSERFHGFLLMFGVKVFGVSGRPSRLLYGT